MSFIVSISQPCGYFRSSLDWIVVRPLTSAVVTIYLYIDILDVLRAMPRVCDVLRMGDKLYYLVVHNQPRCHSYILRACIKGDVSHC